MVQVNVYYETLDTEVTEEKPAYDLNDFGCKYEQYRGLSGIVDSFSDPS